MLFSLNTGCIRWLVSSRAWNLSDSELLLNWGTWDVIDAIWLLAERCIPDKWHCTTAIRSLPSHCVHANNHSDNTSIEKDETQDTDSNDAVEEDWVLWFPLDVAILVHAGRRASGAGSNQDHHKLDQK